MEVVLAIFPPLELVEDTVGEGPETLRADEAGGVEELPVRVHNLRFRLEAIVTASAGDALQVHDARHGLEVVVVPSEGGWRVVKRQFSGSVLGGHCCCCPDVQLSPLSVGPARLPGPARPHSSSSFSSCPRTGLAETGKAGTAPSMGPGGHLKHISTPRRLLFFFQGELCSCVSSH